MNIPNHIYFVLEALTNAGHSAYLVGGCVRDALLGVEPKDFDITTSATPEEIKEIFSAYTLILAGEKHGTVGIHIEKEVVEVTTFRTDGAYDDARHPEKVTFTKDITEDLSRRDFTVNAMAYHPLEGLIDPFNGQDDLHKQLLRAVGVAEIRFQEDALRIMRGLRFSARLGFTIEEKTENAMRLHAPLLHKISMERVGGEFVRMLQGEFAPIVLRKNHCIIIELLPELAPMINCPQVSIYHCYDVWEHTLHTLKHTYPKTPLLVLGAFFHDCGKPQARTRDEEGYDHFHGHQHIGAKIARPLLQRLKMPNRLTDDICTLIEHHDDHITQNTVRLQMSILGEKLFDAYLYLRYADVKAHTPFLANSAKQFITYRNIMDNILQNNICYSLKTLAVDGKDLQTLGLEGKEIGDALQWILHLVVTEKAENNKKLLLEKAREHFIA